MLSKRFNYCFSDVISHFSLRRKKRFKVNFKITKKFSPLTPILLRSHTHQLLEVFTKGRLVGEVELIGYFLDAEIGILEHNLGF